MLHTDTELVRLLKAVMRFVDRHAERKHGPGVIEVPLLPHEMKELRISLEPFRELVCETGIKSRSTVEEIIAGARSLTEHARAPMSDDEDHMVKISDLIARLQSTKDQFGDTCVYIRRGGLAWGAVALNRRDDDKKHGVFDLQAQHDRDMIQRAEQVGRLIASRRAAETRLADAITEIERLQFELKAARNEIEIADGEIERVRAAAPPS